MGEVKKSLRSSIEEVIVSPSVLRALRESSGYSEEEVARKLNTSLERVRAVEDGKGHFTLRQIKKLADIYKRPLAAFFSETINPLPELSDFRTKRDGKLPPEVYLAKRRAVYLAEKLMELTGKKSSIPEIPLNYEPEDLAGWLRKELDIRPPSSLGQAGRLTPVKILDYYKKSFEEKMGLLIIEFPMNNGDVRAFCVASDISVIVLNENEAPQAKLFSIAHEVCHILRKTPSICSIDIEEKDKQEVFCNRFAAELLVPAHELRQLREEVNEESVRRLAREYGVSRQVIAIRLKRLGLIGRAKYEELTKKMEDEGEVERKTRGKGGRDWTRTFFNRAGGLAVSEMRRAIVEDKVSLYEAARILDLKMKYAEQLLAE
ncbi:MAG: XRE family transcriptional regulator [Methanomassiliicoccales archaeon]|jgi:Zn-dependent peptidase ImmA (M78 family)/DNA-binding transcriptional regulator YiaG|nr:XRE family transcriptional regulator [Methanomassiliicoccales archaeon]